MAAVMKYEMDAATTAMRKLIDQSGYGAWISNEVIASYTYAALAAAAGARAKHVAPPPPEPPAPA